MPVVACATGQLPPSPGATVVVHPRIRVVADDEVVVVVEVVVLYVVPVAVKEVNVVVLVVVVEYVDV